MRTKELARLERHQRVRKKVSGDAARPRLSIYRSLSHLYAQLIDDHKGCTLLGLSTRSKEFSKVNGGNVKGAKSFGLSFAEQARVKKITQAVFDRGGYPYHGRVRAFAEGVREGGLKI